MPALLVFHEELIKFTQTHLWK